MLVTDRSQINRYHADQLALKIRFEAVLAHDMRRIIKSIAGDFATYYKQHRRAMLSTDNYQEDVTAILRAHYRKVSKTFKSNIRGSLKAMTSDQIAKLIDARLVDYIQTHAAQQARHILVTLGDALKEGVRSVIIAAAAEGMALPDDEIADRVEAMITDGTSARAEGIAVTETQNMAEYTKLTEAATLMEGDIEGLGTDKVKKAWRAILDESTRIAHIMADGQTVNVDDVFTVGGEQLLFPGDMSQGASIGNVARCRCTAVYIAA